MEIALRDSDRSRWVDPYGRLVETPWSIKINEYVCHIENQEFSELELKVKEGKELTFHEKIYLLACSSKEIWSNFQ